MVIGMDTTTCTVDSLVANAPLAITCVAPSETPMWTDVFSAWGTVLATAFAVVLGGVSLIISLLDHRARRKQESEREEEEHQAEQRAMRRQAQRVACWLEVRFNQYPTHRIIVVNASDEPIWKVKVEHPTLFQTASPRIPVLAPGERRPLDCASTTNTAEEAVDVRFRDNAGRDWYRPAKTPGALLLEMKPTPLPRTKETAYAK